MDYEKALRKLLPLILRDRSDVPGVLNDTAEIIRDQMIAEKRDTSATGMKAH